MLYLITAEATVLFYTGTRYSLLPTCGVARPRAETPEYMIHPPFTQKDDLRLVTYNQQKSRKANRLQTPNKTNTSLLLRYWSLEESALFDAPSTPQLRRNRLHADVRHVAWGRRSIKGASEQLTELLQGPHL